MTLLLDNLPALQIVTPMLAAAVIVFLRSPRLSWFITAITLVSCFIIACALLGQVLTGGVIHYEMGGWEPPFGIVYYVDSLTAFVLFLITGIGAVLAAYARLSIAAEIAEDRLHLFYALLLLCLTGLLGMVITGDAFNVFVFLEISSLASYAIIAMGKDRRALTAAFQYLILGTIGGTFLLIGIGLMYMMTGSLNMTDLAARLPFVADSRTVTAALAFVSVGLAIKLAVFPLHQWLPNAYTYAPTTVTIFLASTATKVAAYALIRFLFTVFGQEYAESRPIGEIGQVLAATAMIAGSLVAIFQTNLKRLLAWSSVAQIGYIVLGISLASVWGLKAALLHMLNHAVIKGALFMAVGAIAFRLGSVMLSDWAGIGRKMPWTMAAFVAGGLSLIGVPLTAGFVSKWALLEAAINDGHSFFVFAILISSLLAVIYIWRIVEHAYFREPEGETLAYQEAPFWLLAPTWFLILVNFWLGMSSSFPARVATQAAQDLLAR